MVSSGHTLGGGGGSSFLEIEKGPKQTDGQRERDPNRLPISARHPEKRTSPLSITLFSLRKLIQSGPTGLHD